MKRMLIIDDEEPSLIITKATLELLGILADCAFDRFEAIKMSREGNYDGYFLDDSVNGDVEGRSLGWAIQERHGERGIPIIWHSGKYRDFYPGPNGGFTGYLCKPWNPEQIEKVLREQNLIK